MPKAAKTRSTASSIRLQIERGGEKLWRHNDFRDQPFPAVAQTLSRLTRNGTLERLSKGVYYRPRTTAFGLSRPSPTAIKKLAERTKTIFPSGTAAANPDVFRVLKTLEIAYRDVLNQFRKSVFNGKKGLNKFYPKA